MKMVLGLAMGLTIATSAFAQQVPAPAMFSIRGGETLLLRHIGWMTAECVSVFVAVEGIDVLDGPPEVSLKFEPGQVANLALTNGKVCPGPLPGGSVMITAAKDITEPKEANLTIRVRVKTKHFSGTSTTRYHLLMFPAASGG